VATLRRLLRIFEVSRDTVGDLSFSDTTKIGVVPGYNAVALKPVNGPGRLEFTTGPGVYVRTTPFDPARIVQWLLLQVFTMEPKDHSLDPSEVTDVRARVWDGTTEFWFTLGAWTAITDPDADWNTIEEVNDAIPDWFAGDPLGLVFELSTIDPTRTPTLLAFRLLYSVDLVSHLDDWIYGALVEGMKDSVRPRSDVILVSDGTASIDFGAVVVGFESSFDVVDVDAVWNEDTDPVHRTDLLASYDTGTQTITLTAPPAAGDRLLIRFVFRPMVAVTTSQDYDELDRSPSILFDRITLEDLGEAPTPDAILNVFTDPPAGVTLPAPRRANLVVSLLLTAPLAVDLHRLAEAVTQYLQERRVITSPTTGDRATLRIMETFDDQRVPNLSDLNTASMLFRLENVYQHHRPAVDAGDPGGEFAYGVGILKFNTQALVGGVCAVNDIETGGT